MVFFMIFLLLLLDHRDNESTRNVLFVSVEAFTSRPYGVVRGCTNQRRRILTLLQQSKNNKNKGKPQQPPMPPFNGGTSSFNDKASSSGSLNNPPNGTPQPSGDDKPTRLPVGNSPTAGPTRTGKSTDGFQQQLDNFMKQTENNSNFQQPPQSPGGKTFRATPTSQPSSFTPFQGNFSPTPLGVQSSLGNTADPSSFTNPGQQPQQAAHQPTSPNSGMFAAGNNAMNNNSVMGNSVEKKPAPPSWVAENPKASGSGRVMTSNGTPSNNISLLPIRPDEYDVVFPGESCFYFLETEAGETAFGGYKPLPNGQKSPAELCHLVRNVGDVFVAIDGVPTQDLPYDQVWNMLKATESNAYCCYRFRDINYDKALLQSSNGDPANILRVPSLRQKERLQSELEQLARQSQFKQQRQQELERELETTREELRGIADLTAQRRRELQDLERQDIVWMEEQLQKMKQKFRQQSNSDDGNNGDGVNNTVGENTGDT